MPHAAYRIIALGGHRKSGGRAKRSEVKTRRHRQPHPPGTVNHTPPAPSTTAPMGYRHQTAGSGYLPAKQDTSRANAAVRCG